MDEPNLPVRADYAVGYGKPPAQHRFAKGKSGNPNGRPKRARPGAKAVNTGLGMRAAEEFLRLEAYREVTIREGENTITLPAIQAVFRAMSIAALKGNRLVQKGLAEMVTQMEQRDHESRMELFGKALDYKNSWDEAIEHARAAGRPEPQPVPHPDDIIVHPDTGAVEITGPQTKEQKARLDEALARRAQAQEEVNYFADLHRRARDPRRKAQYLEELHWEQRMFDILNDIVPKRYKAKLENRSYAPGASREGKALEELRKKRALRKEYVE